MVAGFARSRGPHDDDPPGILDRQRPDQHPVCHSKNGNRRTERESERRHGRDRECGRVAEPADAMKELGSIAFSAHHCFNASAVHRIRSHTSCPTDARLRADPGTEADEVERQRELFVLHSNIQVPHPASRQPPHHRGSRRRLQACLSQHPRRRNQHSRRRRQHPQRSSQQPQPKAASSFSEAAARSASDGFSPREEGGGRWR